MESVPQGARAPGCPQAFADAGPRAEDFGPARRNVPLQSLSLFEDIGGVVLYIQRERLLEAHAILSDPEKAQSISAISEDLCFADASSFSRTFKREYRGSFRLPNGRFGSRPCENSRSLSSGSVSFAFSSSQTVQKRKNREKFCSARSFAKFRRVFAQPRPFADLPDQRCRGGKRR
jgi:AraC-like DNA-binding protein